MTAEADMTLKLTIKGSVTIDAFRQMCRLLQNAGTYYESGEKFKTMAQRSAVTDDDIENIQNLARALDL